VNQKKGDVHPKVHREKVDKAKHPLPNHKLKR